MFTGSIQVYNIAVCDQVIMTAISSFNISITPHKQSSLKYFSSD